MDAINNHLITFFNVLTIDFLRYFIPSSLAFLLCWKLFKKQILHRFIQDRWPSRKRLWNEFKYSMSTVLIFAAVGFGLTLATKKGLTRIYYDVADFGWFYFILSFIIMVLFHDTYFYWTHRWMHRPGIYKYVHKVHHLSTNPSPWAAYSFHPLEAIVQALVFPIMMFSMPVHTAIAFAFLSYMILRNVWGHLGFELLPKKFISFKGLNWNTTTTHHNLHHEKFNSNYGLYFTWWDKWLDTEHREYQKTFNEVTSRKRNSDKKTLTFLLFLIIPICTFCQSPEGKWMTYNEATGNPLSIIHIYYNKSTDTWEGKVDSVLLQPYQGTTPICSQCPDSFQNKNVLGLEFMWGFEKSGNEWVHGNILDPETGDIYSSELWETKSGELKVKAHAGLLDMFYRIQTWRQVEGKGITGLWQTISDKYNMPKSLVRIRVINGKLSGVIEKIYILLNEGCHPICTECDVSLKDKPIVGLKIMNGFKLKDGEWENGTILDPGNGTTYSARFWMTNNNTLKIRGYWGLFYRTQIWKRL